MKKLFAVIVMLIFAFSFTQVQGAEEDVGLPTEELMTEAELQLETIESMIITLIVSLTGTSVVALIVKIALDKTIKLLTDKVKKAEEENKISSEESKQIVAVLQGTNKLLVDRIDSFEEKFERFINQLETTDTDMNTLIAEFKARDENIQTILEESFNEEE